MAAKSDQPAPLPAPLPTSAPLPAPLPVTTESKKNNNDVVLPPAPKINSNLFKTVRDEVYVRSGLASHGKLWARSRCLSKGMIRPINNELPNPNLVFMFVPQYYAFTEKIYHAIKHKSPCIGHVFNYFILSDKAMMVDTLHNYYGDDVFKHIIPLSFVAEYDYINHTFDIFNNKKLINTIQKTDTKNHETWILKSSIGSSGRDVFLWSNNDMNELQNFLLANIDPYKWLDLSHRRYHKIRVVISQYINKPMLYKNKFKFDTRVYVLIAKTNPVLAYYAGMKCRLSTQEYDIDIRQDDEKQKLGHITNTYQQSVAMENVETKEDIGLDWTQFLQFMYDTGVKQRQFDVSWFEEGKMNLKKTEMKNNDDWYNIGFDEFAVLFENKMRRLCGLTLDAACEEFDKVAIEMDRVGQFCFLGVDILIDENGKMWMIELNGVPSIKGGGNDIMKSTLKNLMFEMVDIVWEMREKRLKGINVMKYDELDIKVKYWQSIPLKYYDTHKCQLFDGEKLKLRG